MKHRTIRYLFPLLALCLLAASGAVCAQRDAAPSSTGPVPVRLVKNGEGYQLLRNGKPYFIKGAGGGGPKDLLKAAGANSFRTWGADNLGPQLDEAQRLGLTVTVGIWLGHTEHGFRYDDPKQVADQLERARQTIQRYKDHPAVLLWGIGNEMEGFGKGDDPAVWKAVQDIAAMAKKLDPNHPTMTVVAEIGGERVPSIHRLCPDIDIVGINSYAGAASIPQRYRAAGGTKPYILTEFGPPGTWEVGKNEWGAVLEPTSNEKAASYRRAYEQAVANQPLSLGSYAFTWGGKQEMTATWFGMLLADGARTPAVDTMTELWSGKPPANRAPGIQSLKVDGAARVAPGATVRATLVAVDPESDPIQVQWVLQQDPLKGGVGGAAEAVPPTYPEAIVSGDSRGAEVKMPPYGGGYRLFAYLRDGKGGGSVANVPLFVTGTEAGPAPQARRATLPLAVYDEAGGAEPPFAPSGYMGNAGAIKMDPEWAENPHSGKTCLRVQYTAGDNWGGVVWQSPANDWGDKPGGWNLTGATKLTFWARGEKGGETVSFEMGLIDRDKRYYDTTKAKLERVKLTPEWKQYTIPLSDRDLSRIKTGFVWTLAATGQPVTFYLDDIRYE